MAAAARRRRPRRRAPAGTARVSSGSATASRSLGECKRLRLRGPADTLLPLSRHPSMRDIIQRHNRLNGLAFSIIEFGLIALFIGAFATHYLLHHRAVMAMIASGITLNCVPVVVLGLRQLGRDRATGKPIGSFWDSKARERHRRENPHMLFDAMVLTVATLLPFVGLAAVLFDVSRPSKP